MAFSSATHDIAAVGFYLLAMIAGQGGLVYLAGALQERTGDVTRAWSLVFCLLAAAFVMVALYHLFALPKPAADHAVKHNQSPAAGWIQDQLGYVNFFLGSAWRRSPRSSPRA